MVAGHWVEVVVCLLCVFFVCLFWGGGEKEGAWPGIHLWVVLCDVPLCGEIRPERVPRWIAVNPNHAHFWWVVLVHLTTRNDGQNTTKGAVRSRVRLGSLWA